jgi:hypothetical protein
MGRCKMGGIGDLRHSLEVHRGDKPEKVGITLPVSLLKQADKARGDVPRSTFIRRAVEQYIRGKGGNGGQI